METSEASNKNSNGGRGESLSRLSKPLKSLEYYYANREACKKKMREYYYKNRTQRMTKQREYSRLKTGVKKLRDPYTRHLPLPNLDCNNTESHQGIQNTSQ
jgi:hypothetical protein